jgi:hypothetical protein
MHGLRLLLVLTAVLVTGPLSSAVAAEAPVLAVLEHTSGWFGKRTDIRAKPGVTTSSLARMPKSVWTLREGKAQTQPYPPAERIIQFYRVIEKDPELVCTIAVKYVGSAGGGWRPAYQIVPPPPIQLENGKPVPVDTGLPGSIRVVKTSASTADGYVHSLSFGSITGPIQIDLWEVQ